MNFVVMQTAPDQFLFDVVDDAGRTLATSATFPDLASLREALDMLRRRAADAWVVDRTEPVGATTGAPVQSLVGGELPPI